MIETLQTPLQKTGAAIGIDIGGTKISAARLGWSQTEIQGYREDSTPHQADAFVGTLLTLVRQLQAESDSIVGIGIATAGIVDTQRGEILGSTGNLPALREIPSLKKALEAETGLPVLLENDANAAAYGEHCVGAARGSNHTLMVTLGTGVGTGIVIDGKLVHGAHFSAGESGHIAISMNHERLCTCGRWDCWETYASGTGLAQTARRLLKATPNAEGTQLMAGKTDIEQVTTRDVVAAWRSKDPLAQQMMDNWHTHIATGLGSLLNVLDPEIVVVGGGMAQFVNFTLLTELTQQRAMTPGVKLVPAQLGNQAGIVGAAYLAWDALG